MPELINREGAQEIVEDARVPELLSSGYTLPTWSVDGSNRVRVISPEGKGGTLTVDSLMDGFGQGYRLESSADVKQRDRNDLAQSPLGSALAATSSAADVLSFGGFSQAATALGPEGIGEDIAAAREAHPVLSGAGAVAGALTPGGAGAAIGKIGARVAGSLGSRLAAGGMGSLLQRVISTGAGGAAEGALFGAADLVSEEAIGDAEFTAEALVAHVGQGALLGGGLGAGFQAVGAGIGAAARRVGGKGKGRVKKFLQEFSDETAIRAVVGKQKGAFKKLDKKNLTDDAAGFIREDLGMKLGDSAASLGERLPAKVAEIGRTLDDTVKALDDSGGWVSGADVAKDLRKAAVKKFGSQADRDAHAWLNQQADEIEGLGEIAFRKAVTERRAAQRAASYNAVEGVGAMNAAKRLRASSWNNAIDDAAKPAFKRAGLADDHYKALRRKEWVGIELEKYAASETAAAAARNLISPMEYIIGTGSAVGGAPGAGAALVGARMAARKYGSAAASLAAGRLANLQILDRAATKVAARANKAATLFSKGGRVDSIPDPLRALTAVTLFGTGDKGGSVTEAADLRIAEVRNLMSSPDALADRIAASVVELNQFAPGTAGAAAAKSAQVAQYLNQKAAEIAPAPITPTPLAKREPIDMAAALKFARHFEAAMDPMSVVDAIASRTLTREGVEALRTLYPRLYGEAKALLAARVAERTQPMNYEDLVVMSMFMGEPAHQTMRPEFIAAAQKTYQLPQKEGPGKGKKRKKSSGSALKGKAPSHATPTQQLEEP